MKVRFKQYQNGLTGKIDDKVFYYDNRTQTIFARDYTKPSHNPGADRLKAIMANLKLIHPSEGYKQNFKDYLIAYNKLKQNREKPAHIWNNLYLKMLFNMAKTNPSVDLATLTRQQIYEQNLPCQSVKSAIEAGLLPSVKGYERYRSLV